MDAKGLKLYGNKASSSKISHDDDKDEYYCSNCHATPLFIRYTDINILAVPNRRHVVPCDTEDIMNESFGRGPRV